MADWQTISSLATGFGTLVLAVATFSSVRSSNRSARVAEEALQVGLRPVLMPSRLEDPTLPMRWGEGRWTKVDGGKGLAEVVDDIVYLAMSLRNVADGLAVLQAWHAAADPKTGPEIVALMANPRDIQYPDLDEFRRQSWDLYVPAKDMAFWQGAIRDPDERGYAEVRAAIEARNSVTIHLLYTDHEGGQRVVSRFSLTPKHEGADWMCSVIRHWNLDRANPR